MVSESCIVQRLSVSFIIFFCHTLLLPSVQSFLNPTIAARLMGKFQSEIIISYRFCVKQFRMFLQSLRLQEYVCSAWDCAFYITFSTAQSHFLNGTQIVSETNLKQQREQEVLPK